MPLEGSHANRAAKSASRQKLLSESDAIWQQSKRDDRYFGYAMRTLLAVFCLTGLSIAFEDTSKDEKPSKANDHDVIDTVSVRKTTTAQYNPF